MRSVLPGSVAFATLMLLASCRQDERTVAVASVFDSLAPGLRLGKPAAPLASRYHLSFVPYVGYADTTISSASGLRALYLFVDEPLNSESQRPSPSARVLHIQLQYTPDQATSLRQAFSAHLGRHEEWCYVRGDEARFTVDYWPIRHNEGVLLSARVDSARVIVLGWPAQRPDSNRTDPHPCAHAA
jgi:hypothetical protein